MKTEEINIGDVVTSLQNPNATYKVLSINRKVADLECVDKGYEDVGVYKDVKLVILVKIKKEIR